jgi:predicted PurR-regulated permease PerM
MKEKINDARWLALAAVAIVALYLCWLMLQPFAGVLAWATVLTIVFYPAHKYLLRKIKRPALAAALSSMLVIVAVLLPLSLIAAAVIAEVAGAQQTIQANVASLMDPNSPILGRLIGWINRYVDVSKIGSEQLISDSVKVVTGSLAGRTLGLVGGVIGTIFQVFFVIFTMYYLFRDADKILNAIRDFLPMEGARSEAVFDRIREIISASVYGVVTIATIQGALGGLAFWVLGVPSPVLWGVLMAFVCMIPMVGSWLVWVPAAIYLAVTGHWAKAIALALWGALAVSTIDNFLRPKLVGRQTKLHELLVFFSVLGGLKVFGMLGIVLGPVVLAITLALIEALRINEPRPAHARGDS